MKKLSLLIATLMIMISCGKNGVDNIPAYKNSKLTTEERVNDLIKRMTLEEKVAQMSMKSLKDIKRDKTGKVISSSMDSLFKGISPGCLESPFIDVEGISVLSEAADNYMRKKTRLGIPSIQIAECLHGQLAFGATIFPQAISQGSTWNPELIKRMSEVIAAEASLSGVDQALSPLFDVAREPRYGRVEECFGEDPYHVAEMGNAFVIGMQGEPSETKNSLPDNKLICTAKHYVAYCIPIAGINLAPVSIGPRDLQDIHLYPFRKAVQDANIYSVMPSYNEVNGIPLHINEYLMKDVLRDEIGFDGYVFSDYGAIWMAEKFHYTTANKSETAYKALKAGVDLEAPNNYAYSELVNLAKSDSEVVRLIDESVKNILRIKFKAGLFDKPFKANGNIKNLVHKKSSVELARNIAEESVTLLQNKNNMLPLSAEKLKSIAVIGPNADQVQYGDYSCTKDNASGVTVLEGIKRRVGNGVKVNYAKGCGITNLDKSGISKAVAAARKSDVVVLVIGGTSATLSGIGWGEERENDFSTCGEGFDRTTLTPPGVQPELIRAIHKTGKPIVLVMVHGRPYSITWEKDNIPAILEAWYPGEEGGNAVARILFGDVNPSGKLTMSVPKSVGHLPVCYNRKPSGKGYYRRRGTKEKPGRDYVFSSPDALFPFGYGLSYTSFKYSDLKIKKKNLSEGDNVELTFSIKNTGKLEGKEVAQVYINDKVSSVGTPVKALKGFKKVYLKPLESKTVSITIPFSELGLWNKDMKYTVEPGDFEIMVGSSSKDILLRETINVK